MSYYSVHGMFKDITTGISFYQFLEDLSSNYAGRVEKTIENLKLLLKLIFTKNKMLVSITADEVGCARFKDVFPSFLEGLDEKPDSKLSMIHLPR